MTMSDIYDAISKGLVEAGIFTDDATGEALRTILPNDVLDEIESMTKSAAGSASPPKEEDMANETPKAGAAPDLASFDLPEEVAQYISELEATVVRKADDPSDEEMVEAVLKSMDPAVAEIIKADRERLAKAEATLAEERRGRIRKAFEDKAATYDHIEDENLADVLQSVANFDPDTAAKLEGMLDLVNKRLEKAALFDELGVEGDLPGSDAFDKATQIAKSLVDAGDADSIEAARAAVWEANPDLFDQYQAERG